METIAYGYKRPQNSIDSGDIFFPAWEFNITRLASHNHDGVNSAPLGAANQTISAANWVASPIGGGLYEQEITLPSPFQYDTCQLWFKLSTGEYVYPSITRTGAQKFKVFTNDNSLEYVAYYR